jgi:hypothetical protein
MWVANSSTLICGERDAILVDTVLTTEQSQTRTRAGCRKRLRMPTDQARGVLQQQNGILFQF